MRERGLLVESAEVSREASFSRAAESTWGSDPVCVHGRVVPGKRAGDIYPHARESEGACVVPRCKVWAVHPLGRLQRPGRWGMDHGNAAHQPHGLHKAACILQSYEV